MASKGGYTGDLVFVRNRHPKIKNPQNPNSDVGGVWMTKRERKGYMQDIKDKRAANAASDPNAAARTPTNTVPILTGGTTPTQTPTGPYIPIPTLPTNGGQPNPNAPTPDTSAPPSWWINSAYKNPADESQKFANIANALLPTLAPEDQRTLANYLAQNNKDVYGGYASTDFGPAPTQITDSLRKQFLSPQRAQVALNLLDKMKTASGVQDMGAGYDYLKNAVNLINQFATDGVMTRERYAQFSNAVANLNKNAGQGLSAYANLAQLFNLPQFSAGPLISNNPNNNLFS